MPSATVVSLKTRASQISHLCFPAPGIIESLRVVTYPSSTPAGPLGETQRPLQLGDTVTAFDFFTFCEGLGALSGGSDSSLLLYNSWAILTDATVQKSLLMTQRAESIAVALDKSVNARQNTFYAKYANIAETASVMQNLYTATLPESVTPFVEEGYSKPDCLARLSQVVNNQAGDLALAYGQQPLPSVSGLSNVVPTTSSVLTTTGDVGIGAENTTQNITNTDSAYRTPLYEAQAYGLRTQISLLDQIFSQFMAGQQLQQIATVLRNQRTMTDLDVRQLQIAYMNTILTSPIDGVITGIYKGPGDWVQAGEPVIRVESNTGPQGVILVGTLRYAGAISVGSTLTVTTSPFDSSGAASSVTANVIAVRGMPNEDDLWEVHAAFDPTVASLPPLPPNYSFDYDNTSASIS